MGNYNTSNDYRDDLEYGFVPENEREETLLKDIDQCSLKARFAAGQIKEISRAERDLLERCVYIDRTKGMRNFLKEELVDRPIRINEDGVLEYSWYRDPANRQQIIQEQRNYESMAQDYERQAEIALKQAEIARMQAELEALKRQ